MQACKHHFPLATAFIAFALLSAQPGSGAAPAATAAPPACKDLNTPRDFPAITSRADWEQRAREIREQILVSSGLWPMPEKTPLQAHIFGKLERDGYSVEKVSLQTAPGFYLGGNLYRPLSRGRGPFPGVLNPHGHWPEGRLVDTAEASMPALCIGLARQGMVVFSYDMVGFNDTHFANAPTNRPFYELHRQFGANRADQLWNISLMGLQTWNSIRALDFLASLREVDSRRLACTGASGGGTQTFMLGAIDDRLGAQAPVVMVSHTMQGGCSCENMPGLRVEYSNMEIAAAAAPRPQILVACTRDWTKDTLTVEGPALAQVYQLLKAPERLRYVRFDFGHNYNQTSREAVYEWFGHWLLKHPNSASFKEAPCHKEADSDLLVFLDGKLPADALTQEQFIASLKERTFKQWHALLPKNQSSLRRFKEQMLPAWRHILQVAGPRLQTETHCEQLRTVAPFTTASLQIRRRGESASIQATYWTPPSILSNSAPTLVVLCGPAAESSKAPDQGTDNSDAPNHTISSLLQHGFAVLAVNHFSTAAVSDPFTNFFTTYNRTTLQERVRDLLTVCSAVPWIVVPEHVGHRIILLGTGRAGLWALLAAPGAHAVIADCDQLDVTNDEALLAADLFCPGLRNLGTFEGAPLLAAPHPLLLHNTSSKFPTGGLKAAYQGVRAGKKLRIETQRLSDEDLADWIAQLR